MINNDDIIITDINEIMTYAESKKYSEPVFRIATKKEAADYRKECESLRKQQEEQQHESCFHELPN